MLGVLGVGGDLREEPGFGLWGLHGRYGVEEDLAEVARDVGRGESLLEEFEGGGGTLLGEGEGGFGGEIVARFEEAGEPRHGGLAFEGEDSAEAGTEEFGFNGG